MSWVYRYDPETYLFCNFPYNENLTRALNTTSLNAACHQLTLLTGGKNSRMRMEVQGRLMQARFIEIHQVFEKKGWILFQQRGNPLSSPRMTRQTHIGIPYQSTSYQSSLLQNFIHYKI